MTNWGPSVNGAWRLGYYTEIVNEGHDWLDLRIVVDIWTRYKTSESAATFNITFGEHQWSGPISFNTPTNISWSTDNIYKIYDHTISLNRTYGGYHIPVNCDLSGVDYPNVNFKESVSDQIWIDRHPHDFPDDPVNVTATRISDGRIYIHWTNVNPYSDSNPYYHLYIKCHEYNSGNEWDIDKIHIDTNEQYTWNYAKTDRKYKFAVEAENDDGWSAHVWSNIVYTTPSPPSKPVASAPRITGQTSPSTQSLDLTWTYPSGKYATVTSYVLNWTGPTSGSIETANMYCSVDDLIAGGIYTFTVAAKNPGDGLTDAQVMPGYNGDAPEGLTGPLSEPLVITMLDVPKVPKPIVKATEPIVSGVVEPRTSSVTLSWNDVGVNAYVIKDGNDILGTAPETSQRFHDLIADKTYAFQVYPSNHVGQGEPSDILYVKMPGLPSPPSIKTFMPISGGIQIDLGKGDPNGYFILKYQYRITTKAGVEVTPWTDVPSMSFIETNVVSSIIYTLHVRSVNVVGTGTSTTQSSDAAGGRIAVYDGSNIIYKYIRTMDGIAPVRVFNNQWNLTPY